MRSPSISSGSPLAQSNRRMCPAHRAGTDAKIAAIVCHTVRSAGGESADDDPSRQIPAFPAAAIEFAARSIYAPCYAAKYSVFRLQGIASKSLSYKAESGRVRGGKRKFRHSGANGTRLSSACKPMLFLVG